MDRFIVVPISSIRTKQSLFKIQYGQIYRKHNTRNANARQTLKSNMDRFIVLKLYNDKTMLNFKIQYGQIYSESFDNAKYIADYL